MDDLLLGFLQTDGFSHTSPYGRQLWRSWVEEQEQQRQRRDEPSADEAAAGFRPVAERLHVDDIFLNHVCQALGSVRRLLLQYIVTYLGVERMSIEEVQRLSLETLEDEIKRSMAALKFASQVLLPIERRFCDQIFVTAHEAREVCFAEAAKGCVLPVLHFADATIIRLRSPEMLSCTLGMLETLAGVLPHLETLYSGDPKDFVCAEGKGILEKLRDAVKDTLAEFGNALRGQTSEKPVQGGGIEPLVQNAMAIILSLMDHSESLNQILSQEGVDAQSNLEGAENMTPLGRCVFLLISSLESNLEEKCKLYDDGGMQHIFLMNNIHCIVQNVNASKLKMLLGDRWVSKRLEEIGQLKISYLRGSWTKPLSFLRDDGLGGREGSPTVSRDALRDRLKSSNLAFEEIYKTQTACVVPDEELRRDLRILILEEVFPAYRMFWERCDSQLESGCHAGKYKKYTPEDLENHLFYLFEGLPAPPNHPTKRTCNHPRRRISS